MAASSSAAVVFALDLVSLVAFAADFLAFSANTGRVMEMERDHVGFWITKRVASEVCAWCVKVVRSAGVAPRLNKRLIMVSRLGKNLDTELGNGLEK